MFVISSIVGARFRPPAADVLNNLDGNTELVLVREPTNEHDPNAIKVMIDINLVQTSAFLEDEQEPSDVFAIDDAGLYHLGYIPRNEAEVLASVLDESGPLKGKLSFNVEGRPCVEFEIPDHADRPDHAVA